MPKIKRWRSREGTSTPCFDDSRLRELTGGWWGGISVKPTRTGFHRARWAGISISFPRAMIAKYVLLGNLIERNGYYYWQNTKHG